MPAELPAHVWIKDGDRRTAGLLFEWRRQPNGVWQGSVATRDNSRDPALYWINGDLLTAATTTPREEGES